MTDPDAALFQRLREARGIWRHLKIGAAFDPLHTQRKLRKTFADDVVRAAVTLQQLRAHAAAKFRRAPEMWFTRVGLEQASAEIVARHKAQRFAGDAIDLCCGIGGDTLALAERCDVHAVDRSEVATLCTSWNAEAYGVASRMTASTCDVQDISVTGELVHIDPNRRAGPQRVIRIDDYQPGIAYLQQLIAQARGGAIKVSPASDFAATFPDCEHELISVRGECKEATVWFGELARPGRRSATVLPAGSTLASDGRIDPAPSRPLARFLVDPDPSVKRAGLLDALAQEVNAGRIAGTDCLASDSPTPTPFATEFEVQEVLPSDVKVLRRALASAQVGTLEIKPRHVDIQPEQLRRQLKLRGDQCATLFLLPMEGRVRAVLCRRLTP